MKLLGAFRDFAKRVLDAVRKGGLPKVDQIKLDHLLTRAGKRNLVLAKAILVALDAGGSSKKDIRRFGELLEHANRRILEDKRPFTKKEEAELAGIFRRASLSEKTRHRFTGNLDELLASQINESIKGRRKVVVGIPKKKKTIKINPREKKQLRT
jgi:hypothetical protein